jgi:hypothetical protein
MPQLYSVDQEQADDPEASGHALMSALEIGAAFPVLRGLITGDGTESLTYVHELWRIRIEPADDDDVEAGLDEMIAILAHEERVPYANSMADTAAGAGSN